MAACRRLGARRWLQLLILLLSVLLIVVGCGGRKRPLPVAHEPAERMPGGRPGQALRPAVPLLIRVGLAAGEERLVLQTSGPCRLLQGSQRRPTNRLEGSVHITLRAAGDRLLWSADGQGGESSVLIVQPLDPRHLLHWSNTPYRGELLVQPVDDHLVLINVVELESYLRGVLPWEIGRQDPEVRAALAAQAVAARTYTISHLAERKELGFDIWSDVRDQVYRGAADEDSGCDEAIASTAGLVLRHEGQEIEAYYCSTCGGVTSSVEEVWPLPARPYLRSHLDAIGDAEPFCAGSRRYAWEVSWGGEELQHIMQRTLPEYLDYMGPGSRAAWAGERFTPRHSGADPERPGRLRGLTVSARTTSGRVARLDVAMDAGVYHLRGDRVRWVLVPPDGDPAILWSALFSLDIVPGPDGRPVRVTARGRGFGHGVGLCQNGALAMARRGYDFRSILAHYYPGARLEPLAGKGG
jgi:stage II sporulation protein D